MLHGLRVRCTAAIWSTLSDGEEAVRCNVLEKRGVRASLRAAGSVTPDEHGHLFGAGRLGWVVDRLALKTAVGLVGARGEGSSTTALLPGVLVAKKSRRIIGKPTWRASRGDAVTSRASAASAKVKVCFILGVLKGSGRIVCLVPIKCTLTELLIHSVGSILATAISIRSASSVHLG